MGNSGPKTLQEAIVYFSDLSVCHNFMTELRWPDGPVCPHCKSEKVTLMEIAGKWKTDKNGVEVRSPSSKAWKCRNCRKKFTIKTGTVLEDSPLPLDKWLCAFLMIVNAKNGVSSYEIHRGIGVTQKSAWFMLHRIRTAMTNGTFEKLDGVVEADETFIGGKARFMHKGKRHAQGTGSCGKAVVMGLLERKEWLARWWLKIRSAGP